MTQRMINDNFWTDPYIEDLSPNEKLVFLYLITNPLCNIAGIYEIKRKRICYETGIGFESLGKVLHRLEKDGKLLLIHDWIFIKNFPKNQSLNPNVKIGIQRVINNIPMAILSEIHKAFGSLGKPLEYLTLLYFTLPNFTLPNSTDLKSEKIEEDLITTSAIANEEKNSDIEKIYNFWQMLKQRDRKWKTNRKLDEKIKKILANVFKKYSKEDIEIGVNNYLADIKSRKNNSSYFDHRFSLQEFFSQKNGLEKFYNLT